MTNFDTIAPTPGSAGNSFEWILDINTGTKLAPVWINVPDITGLAPAASPKTKDGTTYANKGNTRNQKVGEDFNLPFTIKGVKDATGEFQPELLAIMEAGDSVGEDNVLPYRYYHATSAALAYEGTAAVDYSRANTGNEDLEFFSVTFTGQGDRKKIANPGKAGVVPTISTALPASQGTGQVVRIVGTGFTPGMSATVGGTAATVEYAGATSAYVTLPTGSAGSAPIVVTTDGGVSIAKAYTRAA